MLQWVDRQEWLTFNTALWLEGPANGFVMWGLVAASSLLAAWQRRPLLAATLFLGFGVLYMNIFLGWILWPRPRPDLIADGLASPGSLSAYPSGHVAQAIFVYGMFAFLWLRRTAVFSEKLFGYLLALAVVGVVGFARLRAGSHWPSDLIAGLIIGVFWTVGAARSLAAADERDP